MIIKKTTILLLGLLFLLLFGCSLNENEAIQLDKHNEHEVTAIEDLQRTDHFRYRALEHILEGELNKKGQAVGFHYDRLPTKKGEIIAGTKTDTNKDGVYEAEVKVENVVKTGNKGKSTFFPDEWDTQQVVDAINEAYDAKTFISGNTYEGLTTDGIVIRMYLDQDEKIISAFPIY